MVCFAAQVYAVLCQLGRYEACAACVVFSASGCMERTCSGIEHFFVTALLFEGVLPPIDPTCPAVVCIFLLRSGTRPSRTGYGLSRWCSPGIEPRTWD